MALELVVSDSGMLAKLVLSVIIGSAIGLAREMQNKPAGMRTGSLICLGAALLTMLSISVTFLSVVSAGVVIGAGVLGAALLLNSKEKAAGLAGAAELWALVAVGVALGAGSYFAAAATAVFMVIILYISDAIGAKRRKS